MNKIRLELETLNVDSFDVAPAWVAAGTVQAHQPSARLPCVPTVLCPTDLSCAVQQTEFDSCKLACDCTHINSPC
jgi:hypothetical protein